MADVAFIGLGVMGKPMVLNLLKGGHRLFLHSRSGVPAALIEAGGAVGVQNSQELIEESRRLLRDATAREQLVTNALRVIQPHREAAARTAALIEKISTIGPA